MQNENFPNFSNFRPEFRPEFCSEFSPNFLRIFRASFRGRRRPQKIHQKSPPFFNAKFPGKHEKNIHKVLLESRQSKYFPGEGFLDPRIAFSWEDEVVRAGSRVFGEGVKSARGETAILRESLNGGLANGGLRYLCAIVHDCLRLSSFCDESSP